jgi:hypothetical protein
MISRADKVLSRPENENREIRPKIAFESPKVRNKILHRPALELILERTLAKNMANRKRSNSVRLDRIADRDSERKCRSRTASSAKMRQKTGCESY